MKKINGKTDMLYSMRRQFFKDGIPSLITLNASLRKYLFLTWKEYSKINLEWMK